MTQAEMIARIRVLERLVERLLYRARHGARLVALDHPFCEDEEQALLVHQQWRNRFSTTGHPMDREYRRHREYERLFGGEPT